MRKEKYVKLKYIRETKFKKTQFKRSLISIGFIADDKNISHGQPITSSVIGGVNYEDFFRSSFGTRKGIVDKDRLVPESGYLERSMVLNLSPITITGYDCGTEKCMKVKIKDIRHLKSLVNRFYSLHSDNGPYERIKEEDTHLIGKEIYLRSPIFCFEDDFKICRTCFGSYKLSTKNVGILTGQYLSERITQLAMRTFHTSGAASYMFTDATKSFFKHYLSDIKKTEDGNFTILVFGSEVPKEIVDELDNNIETLMENTRSMIEDGQYSADRINEFENSFRLKIKNNGWVSYNGENKKELICVNIPLMANYDVSLIFNRIKNMLKRGDNLPYDDIKNTYETILFSVLSLGNIYSSYIETLLCNLYVEKKTKKIFRYYVKEHGFSPDVNLKKYSIRQLHKIISPLLSILYEPNEKTISYLIKNFDRIERAHSPYEEMFIE